MNSEDPTMDYILKSQLVNGTVGVHDYNWPVLFVSIFSVFGILGNLLVCVTIWRDQKLQTKTNYYLFSLAIADLAVCVIVIPLSIIQDFLDILLCTCSIYHLTAVSILRFIAIQFPLSAKRTISRSSTNLNIFLIWFISIFISSAVLYLGYINPSNIIDQNPKCYMRNQNFILYGSIFAFVIPLIIMKVMFSLTVRKLRMQISKLKPPFKNLESRQNSVITEDGTGLLKKSSNKWNHQLQKNQAVKKLEKSQQFYIRRNKSQSNSIHSNSSRHIRLNTIELTRKQSGNTTSESIRTELKALKVLGIVFILFIIAWLPLCLINIGSVLYQTDYFNDFLSYFTYLGYLSSTFNPIIYTAFNQRFRQNFFEILRCAGKKKRIRSKKFF